MTSGIVYLIGAGPGAPDLITIRGRDLIARADVVIYADSLVHPGVAAFARPDAAVYPSAARTLEEVMQIVITAVREGAIPTNAAIAPRPINAAIPRSFCKTRTPPAAATATAKGARYGAGGSSIRPKRHGTARRCRRS